MNKALTAINTTIFSVLISSCSSGNWIQTENGAVNTLAYSSIDGHIDITYYSEPTAAGTDRVCEKYVNDLNSNGIANATVVSNLAKLPFYNFSWDAYINLRSDANEIGYKLTLSEGETYTKLPKTNLTREVLQEHYGTDYKAYYTVLIDVFKKEGVGNMWDEEVQKANKAVFEKSYTPYEIARLMNKHNPKYEVQGIAEQTAHIFFSAEAAEFIECLDEDVTENELSIDELAKVNQNLLEAETMMRRITSP